MRLRGKEKLKVRAGTRVKVRAVTVKMLMKARKKALKANESESE